MLPIKDLSEIGQLTRNESSKQYLEEAIVSYRSGAYRAAIISTWIAVCVDIIEKIRELSLSGDKAAIELEKKLNSIQPNNINGMLDFERKILDYACDELELISVVEKRHLEHLKEDRHLCAHPTFLADGSQFKPSPELTKAYIVEASTYLLSNVPVKGKVVIDRLFNLILGDSFPEDEETAYKILSSDNYLGRVKSSTVRNLTVILLKRIFKDENGLSEDMFEKICSALGAIERLYNEIYTDVFKTIFREMAAVANDVIIKRLFPFLTKRNEAWSYLDKATFLRLKIIISSLAGKELNKYRVSNLSSINQEINDMIQKRIADFKTSELKDLLNGNPSKSLKDIAIKLFVDSESFASAYDNGMHYLLPHVKYFENHDIEILFNGIMENSSYRINQILNAGGMDDIFCQLYKTIKSYKIIDEDKWKNFYLMIKDKWPYFPEFTKTLEGDKVIEKQENAETSEIGEVPF